MTICLSLLLAREQWNKPKKTTITAVFLSIRFKNGILREINFGLDTH